MLSLSSKLVSEKTIFSPATASLKCLESTRFIASEPVGVADIHLGIDDPGPPMPVPYKDAARCKNPKVIAPRYPTPPTTATFFGMAQPHNHKEDSN